MFKIYGVIFSRLAIAGGLITGSIILYSFNPWVSSSMFTIAVAWLIFYWKDFIVLGRELMRFALYLKHMLAPITAVFKNRDIEAMYSTVRRTHDETEQVSSDANADEDGAS